MTKVVTGDPLLDDQLPPSAPGVAGNTGGPYGGAGGGGGGAVDSVNTKTGTVTLTASDVSAEPVDSDLTAIAALATTSYGRALLATSDVASLLTAAGLGSAATHASTDFDASGAAATAQAADQPVDSDLTAIAALATTTYGRSLLTASTAAAARTALGEVIGTDVEAQSARLDTLAGTSDDGTGTIIRATSTALAGKAGALTRTVVKTANYNAAVGDLVVCDTATTGAFAVTLPTAPANKSVITVKMVIQGATNAVTVACGGSDVFNKAAGSTSLTLTRLNESMVLQYDSGIWTRVGGDVGQTSALAVAGDVTGTAGATVLAGTSNVEAIIRANSVDQLTPPAANVSMNSKRLTTLAAATLAADAPRFDQVTNGEYGDGSDGSLVFDGVATVVGIVPSSSVYTLTRDIFATDISISTAVAVNTSGFRIFATGTVTGAGTASITGNNPFASGGSFSAHIAGAAVTAKTVGGSGAGAAGAITAGANGAATTNSLGGAAGAAGAGALAAGTSGTATPPGATLGSVRALPWAILAATLSASSTTIIPITGGAGAGSGGGNGSGNFGGAGGAGAGVIVLVANHIAGALALTAKGGNGEAASGAGNSGGGGAGGGGVIIIVSKDTSVPTTDVTGGTGGAKTGTGTAGSNGSAGTVIKVPN